MDVDTTTGHVSGHQDVFGAGLQVGQGKLSLFLALATVKCASVELGRGRVEEKQGEWMSPQRDEAYGETGYGSTFHYCIPIQKLKQIIHATVITKNQLEATMTHDSVEQVAQQYQ